MKIYDWRDGNTYGNQCLLDIASRASKCGIEKKYDGECSPNCFCPMLVDPVCGLDEKNYINSCELDCEAARTGNACLVVDYPGPCWILSA